MYDGGGPAIGGAVGGAGALAITGGTTFGITLAVVMLVLGLLLLWRSRYLARRRLVAPVPAATATGLAGAPSPDSRPGAAR